MGDNIEIHIAAPSSSIQAPRKLSSREKYDKNKRRKWSKSKGIDNHLNSNGGRNNSKFTNNSNNKKYKQSNYNGEKRRSESLSKGKNSSMNNKERNAQNPYSSSSFEIVKTITKPIITNSRSDEVSMFQKQDGMLEEDSSPSNFEFYNNVEYDLDRRQAKEEDDVALRVLDSLGLNFQNATNTSTPKGLRIQSKNNNQTKINQQQEREQSEDEGQIGRECEKEHSKKMEGASKSKTRTESESESESESAIKSKSKGKGKTQRESESELRPTLPSSTSSKEVFMADDSVHFVSKKRGLKRPLSALQPNFDTDANTDMEKSEENYENIRNVQNDDKSRKEQEEEKAKKKEKEIKLEIMQEKQEKFRQKKLRDEEKVKMLEEKKRLHRLKKTGTVNGNKVEESDQEDNAASSSTTITRIASTSNSKGKENNNNNNRDIHSLNLDQRLINVLTASNKSSNSNGDNGHGFGISRATTIQQLAIPPIRERVNVIIRSQTGSGKTLCYLLPLVQNLLNTLVPIKRSDGTRLLLVAPTRELCHQIVDVANRLVKNCVWLVPGSITGGEKRKSEKARLRKGIVILVATPGRLLDHLKNTQSFARDLEAIVLDEADRLLDMGFEKTIREILSYLENNRSGKARIQKIFASATYDGRVRDLAKVLLGNHTIVDAAGHSITQQRNVSSVNDEEAGEVTDNEEREDGQAVSIIDVMDGDKKNTENNKSNDDNNKEEEEDHNDNNNSNCVKTEIARQEEPQRKRIKVEKGHRNEMLMVDETLHVPDTLRQHFTILSGRLRLPYLTAFCNIYAKRGKVLVFLATCDSVDFHYSLLNSINTWPKPRGNTSITNNNNDDEKEKKKKREKEEGQGPSIYRLHANLAQHDRIETYNQFVSTTNGVLLCTDVAARGLDLPAIDWILQYDTPNEVSDYIHRVGRTARRGRNGKSTILLYETELSFLDILRRRGMSLRELKWQEIAQLLAGAGKKETQQEELLMRYQKNFERTILQQKTLIEQSRLAFQSTIRAYAAKATELKKCFLLQNLHLGHLATSFGLKEPPKQIKVNSESLKTRQNEKKIMKNNKMLDYSRQPLIPSTIDSKTILPKSISTANARGNTSKKKNNVYDSNSEFAA